MSRHEISAEVNGVLWRGEIDGRCSLADLVRGPLGLTGTHLGCETGGCGSCTVLLDGEAVRSCLVLGVQADERTVETVEHAHASAEMTGVVDALVAVGAFQCGFCAPGIVVALAGELRAGRGVAEACDVVLEAHLCRCTGYAALRAALAGLAGGADPAVPVDGQSGGER